MVVVVVGLLLKKYFFENSEQCCQLPVPGSWFFLPCFLSSPEKTAFGLEPWPCDS